MALAGLVPHFFNTNAFTPRQCKISYGSVTCIWTKADAGRLVTAEAQELNQRTEDKDQRATRESLKINALEERLVNTRVECVENELKGNPREGLECETKRKKAKKKTKIKMVTTDQ
jgi:hypothetical protein